MLSLTFALLVACKDQAMIDENAHLKQRVTDLERANQRLEADQEALIAKVKAADAERERATRAAMFSKLGLSDGKTLRATLVTSEGDIRCTLRHEQAPMTVLNFVELARGDREWTDPRTDKKSTAPLYNNTVFHRVIPGFMVQAGDPLGKGIGGPGYQFEDEVGNFTVFDKPGLLAMANSGPDTNGSQFFVTLGTPDHLNGKHTIFGDCDDLDVTQKIAAVERDKRDKPLKDVVLKTVKITVQ